MSQGSLAPREANVLVLGAAKVGKSALTVRFLTRRFIGEYGDAEAVYSRSGTVGGRAVRFCIWDSPRAQAGEKPLRWADGVVLVYSICDRPSFHWARQQLQRLRQPRGRGGAGPVPVVLVGNKRDLQHRRAVPSEEGRLLALACGAAFLEVSAAETYHGALLVFHQLLEAVRGTGGRGAGIRAVVRSVSAAFGRRRMG